MPGVSGLVANVGVAAPPGTAMPALSGPAASVAVVAPVGIAFAYQGTPVSTTIQSRFQAYTSVTAQATMEFNAGQPVQAGLITLASAPWTSMYPG